MAYMPRSKEPKINWRALKGAFAKPRRLHLIKGVDGFEHCPVVGCEHSGFASRRGCRKHVKTKHPWYYYFDEKPKVFTEELHASAQTNNASAKTSKIPCCRTDNEFVPSFSQWLQSSCGGGKSRKQADLSVSRALKFLKLCCDENGDSEDDVFGAPSLIDYSLGSPKLLMKFVDNLDKKWGVGQSAQIAYISSISDLVDFRKFNRPSPPVFQNFAVTEVYLKRARKYLSKDMRANWTNDLDIETLESRRCWASLSEVQSVVPFHEKRYEAVLENCMTCPSSVKPGDLTFATRFIAAYFFLKVKGCRPMTYQHLTLQMFQNAADNQGMVDQKIFKTAKKYGFDSVFFDNESIRVIQQYITYVRPLLAPCCEYVLVNRNGKQFQKLSDLLSKLIFEAIGKYIHPTRYRQIIETRSADILATEEKKCITEDQKHSSNVARIYYQKKRSREVAMKGRACMEKLLASDSASASKIVALNDDVDGENEQAESSRQLKDDGRSGEHFRECKKVLSKQNLRVYFTEEEDRCLRIGVKKFGKCWTKILRYPDSKFHPSRGRSALRQRAQALKLISS